VVRFVTVAESLSGLARPFGRSAISRGGNGIEQADARYPFDCDIWNVLPITVAQDHGQAGPGDHGGINVEKDGNVTCHLCSTHQKAAAADGISGQEGEGGRLFADADQQPGGWVLSIDGSQKFGHEYARPKVDEVIRENR
jgi:hypothetical protein